MGRISEAYFTFKGVDSRDMGVDLTALPTRPHPAARGEQIVVPGRDGCLWNPDGSYNNYLVRVACVVDVSEISGGFDALGAWLTGAGNLIFSDEPNRSYRARVTKEFSRAYKFSRLTLQEFTVVFDCQPYRYVYPTADIVVPSSAYLVRNLGTVPSKPRITVLGSGDINLLIGQQVVAIDGLSGGIVIDSELRDCFTPDYSAFLNGIIAIDEFPVLPTGSFYVSWTGTITKLTITPRWCCI